MLRSLTYLNIATDSYSRLKTVTITLVCSDGTAVTASRNISYVAYNNGPPKLGGMNLDTGSAVVAPTQYVMAYSGNVNSNNAPPYVVLQPILSLTYGERYGITNATVTITSGFDLSDDALSLTSSAASSASSAGVTYAFSNITAALSLSGTASAAVYATLLAGVQLVHKGWSRTNNYRRVVTMSVVDAHPEGASHTSLPLIQTVYATAKLSLPSLTRLVSDPPPTKGPTKITLAGANLGFGGVGAGLGTFVIADDKTVCGTQSVPVNISSASQSRTFDTCTGDQGMVQKVRART